MIVEEHQTPRILIVDDNQAIHDDFDKILIRQDTNTDLESCEEAFFGTEIQSPSTLAGFSVDHALKGQDAKALVQRAIEEQRPYDVAFVDMRMPPGWDGMQTIEELWKVDPDLQIVICTAYSDYSLTEIQERLSQCSHLLILKKPFDTAEVGQLAAALTEKALLTRVANLRHDQLQQMVDSRTAELESARTESERLLNSISSIVVGLDGDGRISRWNSTAEQVFGVSTVDALGKSLIELPVAWESVEDLQSLCCEQKQRKLVEFTDTDNICRVVGLSGFPVIDQGRECGELILGTDLTEHRMLEQQLQAAHKLEAVGQLAAGVAHEINTPMQYIGDNLDYLEKSFDQLLAVVNLVKNTTHDQGENTSTQLTEQLPISERRLKSLCEQIPGAIKDASEGVAHVSRIVRAMKEFSHPGMEEKTPVNINESLRNTITVAANEWKYVSTLTTDFSESLPLVEGFAGELNQVFLNLIVNAAHAIADHCDDTGEIHVTTRATDEHVEITIADTGGGIPEAIQRRVFDPFFTTKEVGKGTGQGLAIAYSVVTQKHGGLIWFKSRDGDGTTFTVQLPIHSIADETQVMSDLQLPAELTPELQAGEPAVETVEG